MATATARRPGVGRGGGRRGGAAALLLVLCAGCLAAGEVSCIKFRMFPQLNPKECVSESVSAHQWDLVLESVEANFRKAAKRNLTDHEVAVRLASFRRPVTIEVGFITMSPNPVDQTMKPIDYVITDDRGNMLNTRTSITQEEVDWKGHVGGRGARLRFLSLSHTHTTYASYSRTADTHSSALPPPRPELRSVHDLLHRKQGVWRRGGGPHLLSY